MGLAELERNSAESNYPPGSLEHLDFISNLEISEIQTLQELQGFLLENSVAESLATFISYNSTSRLEELGMGEVMFDSRHLGNYDSGDPVFWARLTLCEDGFKPSSIAMASRMEADDSSAHEYNLLMPVDRGLALDVNAPLETYSVWSKVAQDSFGRKTKRTVASQTYRTNIAQDAEYDHERNPQVFIGNLQQGLQELVQLARAKEQLDHAQAA
jgi:hypothetical protein